MEGVVRDEALAAGRAARGDRFFRRTSKCHDKFLSNSPPHIPGCCGAVMIWGPNMGACLPSWDSIERPLETETKLCYQ